MHRSPTRKNHAAAAAASSTAAAASLWDGSGAGFTPQQLLKEPRSKRHLEGALKKYTNLLQGWQSRFFVLDPDSGQLRYYLNEALRAQQPPRGSLSLLGAMVISCDEFPFMFTVQATAGDVYKLRAVDAQEQEVWMMQLQLCSRRHSDCSAKVLLSPGEAPQKNPQNSVDPPQARRGPLPADEDLPLFKAPSTLSCLGECLSLFHHNIQRTVSRNQNQNQNHLPSPCPSPGLVTPTPTPTDRAPSWGQPRHSAPLNHVEPGGLIQANHTGPPPHGLGENQSPKHGLSLRTRPGSGLSYGQNQNQNQGRTRADSPGCSRHPSEKQVKNSTAPPLSDSRTNRTIPQTHNEPGHTTEAQSADGLFVSDESTDTEDNEEEELGVLDDQRSIIIHLLSQLKLGMDLTRVVLPTFILEKRSLLEMYANFMAHPDMFLSITSGSTPEERIVRFVEYYLTAFHEGRKGAVAKKPYNPILGETFHCSWSVPRDRVRPLRNPAVPGQSGGKGASTDCYCVRFVAEQVSHHPPVSGFYCECPERQMCVNAHVWTKSKFMGMSVGVSMVGEGVLYLLEHGEEYVFTLPCAYARSILTVPWVELGGKVSISCAQSGYSASVTFHTKPFYGGKVHRVTAEVKHNQTGNIVCKAQGEWNGVLEFTYSNGETKAIDTNKLSVIKKRIRAVDKQSSYESRRLWHHVTDSLKAGNMDAATEHKHHLEEKQRTEEKQRAATKTPWKPKYFIKQGEGWVYNRPLWETH